MSAEISRIEGQILELTKQLVSPLQQMDDGYYATVNASSPAELRSSLHEIIDDHTRFPDNDDQSGRG